MSLLELDHVTLKFGGVVAVDDVSFSVEPGEVFSIIGPNGAGKSTIFNLISRFYEPFAGDIRFQGKSLLESESHEVSKLGIARTFQNIELFEHSSVLQNLLIGRHTHRSSNFLSEILFSPFVRKQERQHARTFQNIELFEHSSVLQNLLIGRHTHRSSNFLSEILFSPFVRKQERQHRVAVEEVIDFLDLQPYRDKMIMGLPYGVRKVVEMGRALAIEPKLLLLDEPASGLSAEETQDVAFWVEDIKNIMGITVLMVEHDMQLVNEVSDRVMALADGKILSIGTPTEVQNDPAVIEAYLGSSEGADL